VPFGGQRVTGFIDARRRRGDVWEALVVYSYQGEDGFQDKRRDWFTNDERELVEGRRSGRA
jgi:hypothetical protein